MDWIDLAQDRDWWRALVNTVWTFGCNKMLGSSWEAVQLAASYEGLSSMELVRKLCIETRTSSAEYTPTRVSKGPACGQGFKVFCGCLYFTILMPSKTTCSLNFECQGSWLFNNGAIWKKWIVKFRHVGFEVFTAVTMKNTVFWNVVPCRSWVNRRFGGMYHLHLQGRKIREQVVADCCHLLTLFPRSRIFLPWRGRWYVPPKRRFTQDLHGSTSHKTVFFKF
jgi:hypothetical protein